MYSKISAKRQMSTKKPMRKVLSVFVLVAMIHLWFSGRIWPSEAHRRWSFGKQNSQPQSRPTFIDLRDPLDETRDLFHGTNPSKRCTSDMFRALASGNATTSCGWRGIRDDVPLYVCGSKFMSSKVSGYVRWTISPNN